MTIFALSTGKGSSGIAIVRVSGQLASESVRILTGDRPGLPRMAVLRDIVAPNGEPIDEGLVVWFPGPRSFTGEDVAEFHIHGGHAVISGLINALDALPGLEPAQPGEFTRRAFENGRLDLTQVEGLADLINAETTAQRRQALRQFGGALGELYEKWSRHLNEALAHLEAYIDFPDEEMPATIVDEVFNNMLCVQNEVIQHLDDKGRGERVTDGIYMAIIGPPNVGKSSLLNLLASREASIVSSIAGTTRDVVEVRFDIGGYPVTLADTAGLREAGDAVEMEGVRRALDRASNADLKLMIFNATSWPNLDEDAKNLVDEDTMVLVNKIDLNAVPVKSQVMGQTLWPVSVTEGLGIERFMDALERSVVARFGVVGSLSLTRARHRASLEGCASALKRALSGISQANMPELIAEDVRLSIRSLGRITGRVDVEDILDIVFRDFCIGK